PKSTHAADRGGSAAPTVVVIGAGIAGLSAAYELSKQGFRVSIFEKEKYTGGRMRETWMGPIYGFTHAEGVFRASREMLALAAEVRVGDAFEGPVEIYPIESEFGTYPFSSRFHLDEIMMVPGLSDGTKRVLPRL